METSAVIMTIIVVVAIWGTTGVLVAKSMRGAKK